MLLFALPIFVAEWIQSSVNPPVGTFACIALVVVLTTWWRIVVRPRRVGFGCSIQAGVLSGLLIVLVPVLIMIAIIASGVRGMTDFLIIFMLPAWLVVMTVMGLVVGTLAALGERFTSRPRRS